MAFWQITRLRVVYPVLLVLLLFVDGALMAGMGGIFTAFPWHVLPVTTLIWLFYGVQFDVDMYYTGIFGTYTVAFVAATALMKQLKRVLDERLLSGATIFLIGLVVYLLITYFAGFVIGIANVSVATFLLYEVLPTVILNTIIATVGYYPVWSLFQFLR